MNHLFAKPGSDRIQYRLALDPALATGALEVQVALLYQSLGARWAAELFRYQTPEVERFRVLDGTAVLTPEVIATLDATL